MKTTRKRKRKSKTEEEKDDNEPRTPSPSLLPATPPKPTPSPPPLKKQKKQSSSSSSSFRKLDFSSSSTTTPAITASSDEAWNNVADLLQVEYDLKDTVHPTCSSTSLSSSSSTTIITDPISDERQQHPDRFKYRDLHDSIVITKGAWTYDEWTEDELRIDFVAEMEFWRYTVGESYQRMYNLTEEQVDQIMYLEGKRFSDDHYEENDGQKCTRLHKFLENDFLADMTTKFPESIDKIKACLKDHVHKFGNSICKKHEVA
jgi:hypothetical protein